MSVINSVNSVNASTKTLSRAAAVAAAAVALNKSFDSPLKQEDVTLFLDADIVEGLLATGDNWQLHFNEILRSWLRSAAA